MIGRNCKAWAKIWRLRWGPDGGSGGGPPGPRPRNGPRSGWRSMKHHRRIAGLLLADGEPGEIRRVQVIDDRGGFVNQPQPSFPKPVAALDVFPRRIWKLFVEGLGQQQVAGQREVRGVEKVERHVLGVVDQRVAELQSVLVDVVEKPGAPHARVPCGVADHRQSVTSPRRRWAATWVCSQPARGTVSSPRKATRAPRAARTPALRAAAGPDAGCVRTRRG